jgi:hypothetical protein
MIHWPFETPYSFRPLSNATGGPMDQTASFQPDVGPAIVRRRTTARVEMWRFSVLFEDSDAADAFDAWFDGTLQGGTLPFVWRRPGNLAPGRFRFAPATYDRSYQHPWVIVTFSAVLLPGALWFAPYMADNTARPPDWVADYGNARYWVNGTSVAATGLSAVTGSYSVLSDLGIWSQATYAGNVPQTAPVGVSWLAGYSNGP